MAAKIAKKATTSKTTKKAAREAGTPAIEKQRVEKVAPLFKKYCSACHNGEDLDGGLNLESFAALQPGGDSGPALAAAERGKGTALSIRRSACGPHDPPSDGCAGPLAAGARPLGAGARGRPRAELEREPAVDRLGHRHRARH